VPIVTSKSGTEPAVIVFGHDEHRHLATEPVAGLIVQLPFVELRFGVSCKL